MLDDAALGQDAACPYGAERELRAGAPARAASARREPTAGARARAGRRAAGTPGAPRRRARRGSRGSSSICFAGFQPHISPWRAAPSKCREPSGPRASDLRRGRARGGADASGRPRRTSAGRRPASRAGGAASPLPAAGMPRAPSTRSGARRRAGARPSHAGSRRRGSRARSGGCAPPPRSSRAGRRTAAAPPLRPRAVVARRLRGRIALGGDREPTDGGEGHGRGRHTRSFYTAARPTRVSLFGPMRRFVLVVPCRRSWPPTSSACRGSSCTRDDDARRSAPMRSSCSPGMTISCQPRRRWSAAGSRRHSSSPRSAADRRAATSRPTLPRKSRRSDVRLPGPVRHRGEAKAIPRLAAERGWDTVVLVTSRYDLLLRGARLRAVR